MTTGLLTSTDLLLRDHVAEQLAWDSQVDASEIGVAAHAGAVTLTGFVGSYAGKLAAERAAKRVRGVRAVANDVNVRLRLPRTDPEIAADIVRALALRVTLPEAVQAAVHHGHVTLTGTVSCLFQKAVAEKALRHIPGVVGIVNRISVASDGTTRDVKRHIVSALHRDADVDARGIRVTSSGGVVVLTGTVCSWRERESAERAAAHAPGVTAVDNQLTVAPLVPGAGDGDDDAC